MPSSRRGFLSGCLGLATYLPLHGLAAVKPANAAEALLAQCLARVPSPRSAAMLGKEYLRCHPREANVALLLDLLAGEMGHCTTPSPGGSRACTPSTDEVLGALHLSDFEHGRTVELWGWVLSRTEARLYALRALT